MAPDLPPMDDPGIANDTLVVAERSGSSSAL
jgi:hypothetical protein